MFRSLRSSVGLKLMSKNAWSLKALQSLSSVRKVQKAVVHPVSLRHMCTGNPNKGLDLESTMKDRLNESVREFKYDNVQDLKEGKLYRDRDARGGYNFFRLTFYTFRCQDLPQKEEFHGDA